MLWAMCSLVGDRCSHRPGVELGELSPWAKSWVRHIVDTLGVTCVVDWIGRFDYFDTDPREDAELRRALASRLVHDEIRDQGLSKGPG